jgi:hypothetical protein
LIDNSIFIDASNIDINVEGKQLTKTYGGGLSVAVAHFFYKNNYFFFLYWPIL